MQIHIGQEIEKKASALKLSQSKVAELTKKTQQTVGNDYKRQTLSIDDLLLYSSALNKNFISYYYEEEPLKSYRKQEVDEWQNIINSLKDKIKQGDDILKAKEETIENQKKAIESLERLIEAREIEIKYLKNKS